MEQKLIIAEILKHKPQGIKLYSPIFGDCTFCYVKDESSDICIRRPYNEVNYFNFDGVYHTGGECLLFPSNEMRDWSKFAWQNGDVLISNDGGTEVIFDKWYDDTYTSFYCKHYLNSEDKNKIVYYEEFLCTTERYSLEDKDIAQTYINTIEKRLDGKLNLETLEIEKPKCEFKTFDKVLGRNEKDDVWEADLFSHYREESQYPFRCIGFSRKYCIPYEGNEHLLGTTDNFE